MIPAQFEAAVPSNNSDFCTRFKRWLDTSRLLADFFSWLLTSSGAISEAFKAEVATYSAPTGTVIFCLTPNVGNGWIEANGQEVSRTTYANLFLAIGTRYGAGDGSTTFNLPDFRGRSPMGAGPGAGLTNRSITDLNVGEERHTMTVAELVPHTHTWAAPEARTDERGTGANRVWRSSSTEQTESTGGGSPFNVVGPSFVAYVFVKT